VTAQQSRTPAETYEYYLGPSLFEPWARVLVERASPRPGERVVDLACGTGIVTRKVAPLVGDSGARPPRESPRRTLLHCTNFGTGLARQGFA
jgi:hypothetical protein